MRLRCATCGAEVSEWAARCPGCRAPADRAEVVESDPPRVLAPPPFPPAPVVPTPRRRARPLVLAAALIALAGVVVLIAAPSPPVRVLAATSSAVVLSRVDGSGAVTVSRDASLVAAPDGRYLATQTGRMLRFAGGRVRSGGRRLDVPSGWRVVGFADGDRALVVVDEGAIPPVAEVVGAGGASASLGPVDMAAGDPTALGAVVVKRSPQLVEVIDVDRPPRVLVTAPEVGRLLGYPPAAAVALVAYPDPTGRRVAVLAVPQVAEAGQVVPDGIVVVDRSGHVVGARRDLTFGRPAWSPDGRTLAYPTVPHHGREGVALWTVGSGPPDVRALPWSGLPLSGCLWAVRGNSFICSAFAPAAAVPWVLGREGDGRLRVGRGPPDLLLLLD